jgi:PEP-CTERM motif
MTNSRTSAVKQKTRENRFCYVVLAAMLTLLAIPAGATVIYNEAINGDLPESSGFPVLTLAVGTNDILGTSFVNFPNGGPNTADFDSFEFIVPAGMYLTGIAYAPTVTLDTTGEQTLRMEAFLDIVSPLASAACQEFYIINQTSIGPTCLVPPGNTFNSPALGANTYLVFEGQFQPSKLGQTNWSYDWTLTVAPVPEPASMVSVGAGVALLGIAAARRRRKT